MRTLAAVFSISQLLLMGQQTVHLEAVVTTTGGRAIRNLEAPDFEIRENGAVRPIAEFSWVELSPAPRPQPAPQDGRRTIVLMLDDVGTTWDDLVAVIAASRKFVEEQIEATDSVGVTASRGGMGIYQQFTSDKRQLRAAIDRIGKRPCWGLFNLEVPRGPTKDPSDPNPPLFIMKRGEPSLGCQGPPPNPIGNLAAAIQSLALAPGRKAIFLFTTSPYFPAPPGLIEAANRAGVVIDVIDPGRADAMVTSRSTVRRLAAGTGGQWVRSTATSLHETMGDLIEEMRDYYRIGFDSDQPPQPTLQVRALRPGLTVHVRRETAPAPEPAVAVPLQLTTLYTASAPDARNKRRHPILRTTLAIDGGRFVFTDTAEGKKRLTLDVAVTVLTVEGKPAGFRDQRYAIQAVPDRVRQISEDGVTCTLEVPLTGPGPYLVRAAVILPDAKPAASGFTFDFLEVPDFNSGRLQLSSIALDQSAEFPGSRPAWREFAAGSPVNYSAEVFGAPPAGAHLDARLLREDRVVLTVPKAAPSGRIVLPRDLEPGPYLLELRASAPKNRTASQWAALTVVRGKAAP